jgi:hypothetical protein
LSGLLWFRQGTQAAGTKKLPVVFSDALAAVEVLATRATAYRFALRVKVATELA